MFEAQYETTKYLTLLGVSCRLLLVLFFSFLLPFFFFVLTSSQALSELR